MSSIALSGNAAGAGVFTLASPNSASSYTATLPEATTTLVGTDATQTLTNKTFTNFPTITNLSYIFLNTANGYGSTNTKIRRFTNVVNNVGSDITYADSATLGATFTINTNGIYSASFNDMFNTTGNFGLSINSSQLTTDIQNIAVANILTVGITPFANQPAVASATFYAAAGTVIRAHTQGNTTGSQPNLCQFTMARVA